MAKVPYVNYTELDEFITIPAMCSLVQMDKAELKQKCEQYKIKPRRNEIGQYGFVKYDFCKLHNLLYYENRNDNDRTQSWEDDPWK